MESLADDVVGEILNGFSYNRAITCPICKDTIVLISQNIEVKSDFYYCAKCGFTLSRPRK